MPTLDESLAALDALALTTAVDAASAAHSVSADAVLADRLAALERAQRAATTAARAGQRTIADALARFPAEHDGREEPLDALKEALAGPLKNATITALADAPSTALGATTAAQKTALRTAWEAAVDGSAAALEARTTTADAAAMARSAAHDALRAARAAFGAAVDLLRSTNRRQAEALEAAEAAVGTASDASLPAAARLSAALHARRLREGLADAIADGGFSAGAGSAARRNAYQAVLTAAATAYESALEAAVAADRTWFEAEAARLVAARDLAVAEAGGEGRWIRALTDAAASL
ncbi:MAG: hypothetical protein H6738_20180 [Alphaproteobacteria bacterium]|nr:hypothetical protein [Alphaproteobacteria bacterium]